MRLLSASFTIIARDVTFHHLRFPFILFFARSLPEYVTVAARIRQVLYRFKAAKFLPNKLTRQSSWKCAHCKRLSNETTKQADLREQGHAIVAVHAVLHMMHPRISQPRDTGAQHQRRLILAGEASPQTIA